MAKYLYKKRRNKKLFAKLLSLTLLIIGGVIFLYTFFPLISWQVYFAPAFASSKIDSPIPNHVFINPDSITSLIGNVAQNFSSDYTNAYNWYPGFEKDSRNEVEYTLSIPKIGIKNALVSNKDTDLTTHLVQYNADTYPPNQGNTIIFGHSTLPQLYDPNDYKTIFANAYKLEVGDELITKVNNQTYTYKIESITVVDPDDTSPLAQNFSDSFITVITCTPPGTLWKRLIVKGRIQES
jgi:sortase A